MTLVAHPDEPARPHPGELQLRRFRVGELAGAEHDEIARHTGDCAPCRARLRTLEEEQRQFEREIPFDRFAGGVERARRVPRARPRRVWTFGAVALAAAGLVLVLRPRDETPGGGNRIKGAGEFDAAVLIASLDGKQRAAGMADRLRPGDRLRIGYRTADARHLVALAVDGAGEVTPIYPERGAALPIRPEGRVTFLPDSLELTGRGLERIFLALSDEPVGVGRVVEAARAGFQRSAGDLQAFSVLPLPRGKFRQFTWLFQKP
jgi:hypothetical protein